MMTGLSRDDIVGTAAGAARQVGWDRPMAGKTGTTQQHKSAAFVGVVPQMAGRGDHVRRLQLAPPAV